MREVTTRDGSGDTVAPGTPAGDGPRAVPPRPAPAIGAPAAEPPRDPLAESLALLARLLERPVSPTALTAGLPLVEGRLTPALAVRAAARAGLAARLVRRSLPDLCELLVPC
ncbi:MAG TPA: hypothetical protein ENJ83_01510, partial [Rhodospirillales bacterium]|nr:hypothetical protein [Rhodospirillales bacterium]